MKCDFYPQAITKFKPLMIIICALLSACGGQRFKQFKDELGAPGIYVDPSGYVIFIKKDMRYAACDKDQCVEGPWEYQAASDDPGYPEIKVFITLIDIFKTKFGEKMERDAVYGQYTRANYSYDMYDERVRSDYNGVVRNRLSNSDPKYQYALQGPVMRCYTYNNQPCLKYNDSKDIDGENGFLKVASYQ
jgi:hypothetical protein